MSVTVSEYIDVRARIRALGCIEPVGFSLLPSNFESAESIKDFRQPSESATVRTLFRTARVPLTEIVSAVDRPPYVQNNWFEWVAPCIFISLSVLSSNPNYVAVAMSVLANYLTDFFKGIRGNNTVKLDLIIETTRTRRCKKVSYEGSPEGLTDLPAIIRELDND